jgi:uncharacterized protein (TIGR02231 family)
VINGFYVLMLVAPVTASPPVTDVIVYADRARVTRRATVDCAGTTEVTFPALPAAADVDSLQADATGARVVAVRWERPPPDDQGPAAARELQRVRAQLAAMNRQLARADSAGARAEGYGTLVESWAQRGLWRAGAVPARWAAAAETVLDESLTIVRERATAQARLRALTDEEATLARQLEAEVAARRKPLVTAHVHLACRAARAQVALHYLAAGASWHPAYEVRAHEAAVELVTYATVHQTTGEAWHDVRLSLSTARPGDRATPPRLSPLLVWSTSDEARKQIVTATEEIPHAPSAAPGTPTSPSVLRHQHGLATDLLVPGAARVSSDGADVRLLVARTHQPARLRLRAAPRLNASVFRVAELVNKAPFPLLPGRLEIFRQGTFIGSQPLDEEVPTGGQLLISFGADERVRLDRVILREVERSAGLLGRAQHHLFAYRFQLASHLDAAEEIELVDHVPVSQLDDVKVVLEPSTTSGYHFAAEDGLVSWRVRLSPGEEKALELAFRVEVPAGYR